MPAYNWEGNPFGTWAALVFFPYGMTWTELNPFYNVPFLMRVYGLRTVCTYAVYLAPLPLCGVALAVASQRQRFRMVARVLVVTHTVAMVVAALLYYRHY